MELFKISVYWMSLVTLCLTQDVPDARQELDLTETDFRNAKLLPEKPGKTIDPVNQEMFEGDIHLNGLSIDDFTDVHRSHNRNVQSNGIRSILKRWPNGQIPYTITNQFSTYERSRIAATVLDYEQHTCIRWVPRTSQRDYVRIFRGDGCWSMVGRQKGVQSLSLGAGCLTKGIIIHELMHTVGFFHEQSRYDRDNYVIIHRENVILGNEDNFKKYSIAEITHLGTSYDYESIMHYGKYAFSKNSRPTIVPKRSGVWIGQRDGFSDTDINKINRMYRCHTTRRRVTKPPKPVTPRPDATCQDDRRNCATYKRDRGGCSASWMQIWCRETCGLCKRGGAGTRFSCKRDGKGILVCSRSTEGQGRWHFGL